METASARPVVIIGAGQGGLQAAESLRSEGFQGEILLLGAEAHAPYHRPPLSKGLLLGETSPEQLAIRQPAVFGNKKITLRTGAEVAAIDPAAHALTLADGETIAYHALVLATGARPRRLAVPGGDAAGVHVMRTLDDAQGIAAELPSVQQVVVVGGGFIGLEMAAVARKLGKAVTVIEFADRLMARVVAPPVSAYFRALHEGHGCTLLFGLGVVEVLTTPEGRVRAVRCSDGSEHAADMVVLGVGVEPETALAEAAGLVCERGVVVDACGRTSDTAIFALGDCAAQRTADGGTRRLESVQNAVELAKACAAAVMGKDKPFSAAPWFWSDQYDRKLQMVGLSAGYDTVVERPGEDNGAAWYYFRDGTLIALDTVNRAAEHMMGRKLLAGANTLTPEQAADAGFDLKAAL